MVFRCNRIAANRFTVGTRIHICAHPVEVRWMKFSYRCYISNQLSSLLEDSHRLVWREHLVTIWAMPMSGLVASSSSSSSSSSRRSVAVISKPQRSFDYSSVVNRRKSWHTKDILYLNVLITRQEMARLLDKHATTRRALRRLNIAAVYSACTCRGTYIHMSSIRIPSAILLTCCQFSSVCEKYTRSDTIAENVRTRIPRSRSN